MRRWGLGGAALGVLLLAARASAQAPPPPDPPNDVAVPRGASGAVIKEEQPPPAAPIQGITLPKPTNYSPPVYPPEALKDGIEGEVTLALTIDKEGHVRQAEVRTPGGHGFDEALIEAVKKIEFTPAKKRDGTPFAAKTLYRYHFTITTVVKPPPSPAPRAAEQKAPTHSGVVLVFRTHAPIAGATLTIDDGAPLGATPSSAPKPPSTAAGRRARTRTAPSPSATSGPASTTSRSRRRASARSRSTSRSRRARRRTRSTASCRRAARSRSP